MRYLAFPRHGSVFLRLATWLVPISFLIGVGCRSLPPELVEPPAPAASQAPFARPGIKFNVTVEVEQSIQTRAENVRVSPDGDLGLPLVGDVRVDGMTLRQMEAVLEREYAEFYVRPSVRVDFAEERGDATSPWGYVTVLGQVRNPGRVNLPPTRDLTVTRAIQLAGGLGTSARQRSVRVTRVAEHGGRENIRVNLRKVGARGAKEEDLVLKAGDVVFVPETFF